MVGHTARARGSISRHCDFGRCCHVLIGGAHQPVWTSILLEIDSISLICRSPLGKLAPGNAEIDKVFKDMWAEAEKNRTKWSCESRYRSLHLHSLVYSNRFDLYSDLGRTATLFDISDNEGITTFWISYWKDLKSLQEFANSSAHRLGQDAYLKKKFPYMGIMHETFHSPKGSWETIYDNVPPLGFGKKIYQTLQH